MRDKTNVTEKMESEIENKTVASLPTTDNSTNNDTKGKIIILLRRRLKFVCMYDAFL